MWKLRHDEIKSRSVERAFNASDASDIKRLTNCQDYIACGGMMYITRRHIRWQTERTIHRLQLVVCTSLRSVAPYSRSGSQVENTRWCIYVYILVSVTRLDFKAFKLRFFSRNWLKAHQSFERNLHKRGGFRNEKGSSRRALLFSQMNERVNKVVFCVWFIGHIIIHRKPWINLPRICIYFAFDRTYAWRDAARRGYLRAHTPGGDASVGKGTERSGSVPSR